MLGEACDYIEIDSRGIVGDRIFAIRDADGKIGSGKTTRRFRQIDGLFGFRAVSGEPAPQIIFPDGRRFPGDDPRIHAALSETLSLPVTLAREEGVSQLDSGPVHIVTTASLAWLRAALPDARVDERRFRPNLLIDVAGAGLIERGWLGKMLRIGKSVRLHVNRSTERCRMVTLAQADLPVDSRVLTRIGRDANLCFGVYAEVVVPGRIARGDHITEP